MQGHRPGEVLDGRLVLAAADPVGLVLAHPRRVDPLGQVLVTLGMAFIISDACLVLWGGDSIPVPTPQNLQSPTRVFGFVFPTYRLVLVGCAIGAGIVVFMREYLSTLVPWWQYALGGLYVLTILYLPGGVLGIPERFRQSGALFVNRRLKR